MSGELRSLVVEDCELDYNLLLVALERGGFAPSAQRVETREELEQALATSPWQIVISDFDLPGFDGLGALQVVRSHDPDLPFLMVSGAIDEEQAVNVMRAGAQDYLFKGKLTRLVPVVRRELAEYQRRRHARAETEAALARERELGRLRRGFVSMVSHEFRTPLGVIRLASEILERYGDRMDAQSRREQTAEIRQAVEHMVALMDAVLLNGTLNAARVEFNPVLVELRESCNAFAGAVRKSTGNRCPIRVDAAPVEAIVDAKLLQIIITNLLTNAVKYSSESAEVELNASTAGDAVQIEVLIAESAYPRPISRTSSSRFTGVATRDRFRARGWDWPL
jgi:signal transduction histidine kinase